MKNSNALLILVTISIITMVFSDGVLNNLYSRLFSVLFGCTYFIVKQLEENKKTPPNQEGV